MAKRDKKNDPQQKNKQGFDSAIRDTEFSKEIGSARANELHMKKAKKKRAEKRKNGDLS